jgi:hypothetical protein
MRVRVLSLTIAAVLATAGVAAAQTMVEIQKPLDTPGDRGGHSDSPMASEVGNRQYRYLMRIETLKEKVAQTKARDGGQITPEHEAALKRELDRLNHIYGVKAG